VRAPGRGAMAAVVLPRLPYAGAGFVRCQPFGMHIPGPHGAFMTQGLR